MLRPFASDAEAFRAMHLLAEHEGISVEPAAAVGFAGLIKLAQQGKIDPEAVVVVNCTGHTMPIGEELLSEGWSEEILLGVDSLPESPQDGLLAALARLDQRRTKEILIVDDNTDSRRLILRILQAHGDFTLREAQDGSEALERARHSPPDLLILDLMMPEMDGFRVLDELRADPTTNEIPVIVVTAKSLTPQESERLQGRITHLMLKGDLLDRDLIREIQQALT
jgi:threonine synthase